MKCPGSPVVQLVILLVILSTLAIGCAMVASEPGGRALARESTW